MQKLTIQQVEMVAGGWGFFGGGHGGSDYSTATIGAQYTPEPGHSGFTGTAAVTVTDDPYNGTNFSPSFGGGYTWAW